MQSVNRHIDKIILFYVSNLCVEKCIIEMHIDDDNTYRIIRRMSTQEYNKAIEEIYSSLRDDNADLDLHIKNLRDVMRSEKIKDATFDPSQLVQNNREGRKRMQAYFKKRGVKVSFKTAE